jgi:hypothetical protein
MKGGNGTRSAKGERKGIPNSWSDKVKRLKRLRRFEERYSEHMKVDTIAPRCYNLLFILYQSYVMSCVAILAGYSSRTSPIVLRVVMALPPPNLLIFPILSFWTQNFLFYICSVICT